MNQELLQKDGWNPATAYVELMMLWDEMAKKPEIMQDWVTRQIKECEQDTQTIIMRLALVIMMAVGSGKLWLDAQEARGGHTTQSVMQQFGVSAQLENWWEKP